MYGYCAEKNKTLLREIKEYLNKWKATLWLRFIVTVGMKSPSKGEKVVLRGLKKSGFMRKAQIHICGIKISVEWGVFRGKSVKKIL